MEQFLPDNTFYNLSIVIYFMVVMLQWCFNNFVRKGHPPGPTSSFKEVVAKRGVAGYT